MPVTYNRRPVLRICKVNRHAEMLAESRFRALGPKEKILTYLHVTSDRPLLQNSNQS